MNLQVNRVLVVALAMAVVIALTVSCGDDSEQTPRAAPTAAPTQAPAATPIATPAQTPAATPSATPTPAPTARPTTAAPTPTPTPAPAREPLETLVLSPAVTGRDLTDRLSEDEAACIRAAMGDSDYESFQSTPFTAEINAPYERMVIEASLMNALFGCMASDNIPVFGTMVMDTLAGGWTNETRGCVASVIENHPETISIWLGVEELAGADSSGHENHTVMVDVWDCFAVEEQAAFILHSRNNPQAATTGQQLMENVLTPEELSCMSENLSESSLAMIREVSSLGEAVTVPGAAAAYAICIAPDIFNRIYVNGFGNLVGGLSDDSYACLLVLTVEHPRFVELTTTPDLDISTITDAEILEAAKDGQRAFDCLTEEELLGYQRTFAQRWATQ